MKFMYSSGDRPLDGYTIKRGVGRGGFGEVYFAESDAGKEVAMKLIRRNLDIELRGVRHCLNLKHANLISLYDIRTDDGGDDWVIMEYVSGPGGGANSLEEVLEQHPQGMPEVEVLAWMRGIAAGVSHLHDSGIVHRDLKPGNIFLDGQTVKIGDYGLSKFISCSRRSGQTESVGTVHYMAPEIANGRYGREIDTYALGIILYEMLTGHVPFEGESIGEVLMKHLTAEPDLEKLAPPYRDIVQRALAKDPETRLRSVSEMVALLPGGNEGVRGLGLGTGGRASDAQSLPQGSNSPAPSPQALAPPAAEDEPIFRAVADITGRLWDKWETISPGGKLALGFAIAILGFYTARVWIPAVVALSIFYAFYYFLWVLIIRPSVQTGATPRDARPTQMMPAHRRPPPARQERHHHAAQARRLRLGWREVARRHIAEKPWRRKTTELLGSMLVAAGLCIGGSALITGVMSGATGSRPANVFAWFAVVSTLGTWAVLATNKFTEGKVEDQVPMRGLLLALGAGVGLLAGAISMNVSTALPNVHDMGPGINHSIAHELWSFPGSLPARVGSGIRINPAMGIAYFASLFLMLRWWRLAEFTRHRRLSLWSVAIVVFAAWLLHLLWWFPQPTGMIVAAMVAIATQLASPWMPPSKREELARGGVV